MTLSVRLLGAPSIVRDGEPVRLGGRKTWALLTYLVLEERPPSRRDVIGYLVPDANDPLAAFRWQLHQVRRALHPDATIVEDAGRLVLDLGEAHVDALEVLEVLDDPERIARVTRWELLEGMAFDDAPTFELWLAMQRTRMRSAVSEALWWAATRLASKDPGHAMALVERGLSIDPYCETKHELRVDLLMQTGDRLGALAHVEAAKDLYRRELGVELPPTIARPLHRSRERVPPEDAVPAARALLQVARSRLAVGEYDAALTTARRSADLGLAADDPELELGSLSLLSSVLIHSCRGRSLEAKGLLGRAAQLATDLGDLASESDIERELGFVLWIEGNLAAAEASFARSIAIADGIGDGERAAQAETYLGACANDRCDLGRAGAVLGSAIERFERAGSRPWLGYAEAMHARVHLRSGQPDRGRRLAELAVQRCRDPAATAFLPWALIAFGECALALDDPTAAHDAGVQALTFATEFGDPSVEVLARRLLALVRRARGDELGAIADLERAAADAARSDDVSAWARASTLTDLVELQRDPDEDAIAGALGIATEGPMPDLVARLRAVRRERQTVLQTAPS